jgi:hypothetical protein
VSPELQSKIAHWRAKAVNGTLTADEMREAITALRQDRVGAAVASATSKAGKVKAAPPDASSLLDELEGL